MAKVKRKRTTPYAEYDYANDDSLWQSARYLTQWEPAGVSVGRPVCEGKALMKPIVITESEIETLVDEHSRGFSLKCLAKMYGFTFTTEVIDIIYEHKKSKKTTNKRKRAA